jgi:hypothetical protein
MRVWPLRAAAGVLALAVVAGACSNPLGPKYEYEEQVYLRVDGSADVIVDSSIAALVALRNFPLEGASRASITRDEVRTFYVTSGCPDTRVGQPWARGGRRFVQIRIAVSSFDALTACGPLAWSQYLFARDNGQIHFVPRVGPPEGRDPGPVNWNGSELVGFKLHAPSRISYHNVRRLSDGLPGKPDRGNILTWEQRLTDRRAGLPLVMDVWIGGESILYRTLWLFAGAFTAAALMLLGLIWWTIRRARRRAPLKPAA